MDLKEKIVSSYVAFEGGVNVNSDVHDIRTEAFQNFEKFWNIFWTSADDRKPKLCRNTPLYFKIKP